MRQEHYDNTKARPSVASQDIATRLANWGDCQRGKGGGVMATKETRRSSPYGGQGYKCMTLVVCNMMRMQAKGPTGGAPTQAKLDFEDAATIHRAWGGLCVRHKLLLRDLYALGRPVNVICREMDIKHWPASHFKGELLAAQAAIEKIVDNGRKQGVA